MREGTPGSPGHSEAFLARLDVVQVRLQELSALPAAPGLTDPDPPTGERWDWGQVWAHLAEFVPYWCGEVRLIVEAGGTDPVPFGRTKADPIRIAAIDADRHRPPPELMERLGGHLHQLRAMIRDLSPGDWERRGAHSTLGVVTMPAIVQDFLVGHLEAHADQLDGLLHDRSFSEGA